MDVIEVQMHTRNAYLAACFFHLIPKFCIQKNQETSNETYITSISQKTQQFFYCRHKKLETCYVETLAQKRNYHCSPLLKYTKNNKLLKIAYQ